MQFCSQSLNDRFPFYPSTSFFPGHESQAEPVCTEGTTCYKATSLLFYVALRAQNSWHFSSESQFLQFLYWMFLKYVSIIFPPENGEGDPFPQAFVGSIKHRGFLQFGCNLQQLFSELLHVLAFYLLLFCVFLMVPLCLFTTGCSHMGSLKRVFPF